MSKTTGSTPDYRRNFTAGLVHGVFFQISAALGSIHTVLPAFVALLTPSTYAVGLMASVQGIGEVVPQLFTAYLIEDRPRKKPLLLAVITLRWVSWALLALLTFWFGASHPGVVLTVLLVSFSLFSLAGGAGTVLYANIFSKAIPTRRRGLFTGWKQLLGYTGAIAAGWAVTAILSRGSGLTFPENYALIFLLSSVSLLVAFTGFVMIREPVVPVVRASTSMRHLLRRAVILAKTNRNFRRTLWARGLIDTVLALSPFYIVYALTERSMNPAMVGIYLAVQMGGGALSNLLWGWLGDRFGNRAVIVGTAVAGLMIPVFALLVTASDAAFLGVFAGIGATMSGVRLGYGNLILEMAVPELLPTCVALQNTLLAPVALMPLAVAGLATVVTYPTLFSAGTALMLVGVIVAFRVIDPRHDPDGKCLEPTPAD